MIIIVMVTIKILVVMSLESRTHPNDCLQFAQPFVEQLLGVVIAQECVCCCRCCCCCCVCRNRRVPLTGRITVPRGHGAAAVRLRWRSGGGGDWKVLPEALPSTYKENNREKNALNL